MAQDPFDRLCKALGEKFHDSAGAKRGDDYSLTRPHEIVEKQKGKRHCENESTPKS